MKMWRDLGWMGAALATSAAAAGITVDPTDTGSLKAAASQIATGMLTYYHGTEPGQVPGLLQPPYYWWEAGGMMGQLVAYSNLTGDHQYDNLVKQALLFQIGQNDNYMPTNQTSDLGNDDQVFWAFSAMDAAETNFVAPGANEPSWVALAQAVFNSQVPRWDTATCGGGLRWQVFQFNTGYDYKNTISTGGLFQLSARLARYTGNQTYTDWANKTWDWMWNSPMMDEQWWVWDGTWTETNCTTVRKLYWTYNAGTLIMGAAYMYDLTNGSSLWQYRLDSLLRNSTEVFWVQSAGANSPPHSPGANGQILSEVACEWPAQQTCDQDEPSFKAYTARWLHVTMQLAPFTQAYIQPRLQASAIAAGVQCSGTGQAGSNACGRRWYQTTWDGETGVGEQMSAMSVMVANLPGQKPLSVATGATSKGDPSAGAGVPDNTVLDQPLYTRPITAGDKAGAGILCALSLILAGSTTYFMLF